MVVIPVVLDMSNIKAKLISIINEIIIIIIICNSNWFDNLFNIIDLMAISNGR